MAWGFNAIQVLYNAIIEGVCVRNVKEALNQLKLLIENLGSSNVIQELWENISTSTQGTITTYQRQPPNEAEIIPINQDKSHNEEDALVVSIEEVEGEDRPVDKPIFDANGEYVLADIDASGNYVLHIGYDVFDDPIPPVLPLNPANYALIWQLKGQAKDMFVIPSSKILDEYDLDPAFVRRPNGDIVAKKEGDDLNMETGGFKDFFVSVAKYLGDALNTIFLTDNQTIIGSANETNLNDISAIGTGILWGLEISINAIDDSKIDVSEGEYRIVNSYDDRQNPTYVKKYFAGATGVSITLLLYTNVTFPFFNSNGELLQSPSPISGRNERVFCAIGIVLHPNKTNIREVGPSGNVIPDSNLSQSDQMSCFKSRINCKGNKYYANGNNLKMNKSLGSMFGKGINYGGTNKTSDDKELIEVIAVSFLLIGKIAGGGTYVETDLIPTNKYDPNRNGVLVDIPLGKFVNHRILIEPSTGDGGSTFVQYGQKAYDTMKEAVDSAQQDDSFEYADELASVHTRSILSVQQGATDLSDKMQARFTELGTLGVASFKPTEGYADFSNAVNVILGLSNDRQAISYYDSGGVLYMDIAKEFNFERDDISFANADKSINTIGGDFDNNSLIVGARLVIIGSVSNDGIYEVASISTLKITVVEAIINESAGSDITIETLGFGDIKFNLLGVQHLLDCTTGAGRGGRARVQISEGTDNSPQENWTYITRDETQYKTAKLIQAITEPDKIDGGYSMICTAFAPSIASTIADGFYNSRRHTDSKSVNGRGFVATLAEKLRDPSDYKSGLLLNITIDTGPTPDDVDFTMDAGIIKEIYKQNARALQLSIDGALVVNYFGDPYHKITNINEILVDSKGATLNNKYFSIGIAISLNADGYPDRLLIKVPNGSYINPKDAYDDTKGYLDMSMPLGFKSVYYLGIAVFRKQSNSWTNIAITQGGVNYIDKRGDDLKSSSSGSGTIATQEFSDGNFALFNSLDSTKILKYDLSGITTLNTRTWTVPDRDLDLGDMVLKSGLAGGQTINGGTLTTETLSLRNNAVDGLGADILDSGVVRSNITDYETLVLNDDDFTNKKYVDDGLSLKANDDEVVHLTGTEEIGGEKTFTEELFIESVEAVSLANVSDLAHISASIVVNGGLSENFYLDDLQFLAHDVAKKNIKVSDVGSGTIKSYYTIDLLDEAGDGLQTRFKLTHDSLTLPFQPSFEAHKSSNTTNVTGDGTGYTVIFDNEDSDVGEIYNNSTGVFTAPVDGYYKFTIAVRIEGLTSSHTIGLIHLVTSAKSMYGDYVNPYGAGKVVFQSSFVKVWMDAGDTAHATITVSNGTKVVDVQGSNTFYFTYFTGGLDH